MWKRTAAVSGAGLALALVTSLAAPAAGQPGPGRPGLSGGSDTIVTSGACDAGSTWTLSGRSRFLRIVLQARIETGQRRSAWVLQLRHNQTAVATVVRRSTGRGVVKAKGRVRNLPGPDTFTFTARNRTTGETCQGTLAF